MKRFMGAAGIGLKYGVITGIAYMILLFVRYRFLGSTPYMLGIMSAIAYLIIVALFVLTAYSKRKQLGGYATVKDLFGAVFIVILIAELCFTVFNYVYLKFIDPGYLERFGQQTLEMMEQLKASEDKIQEFEEAMKGQKNTTIGILMFGWAQSVVMDSVAGIIISFIMRKRRPEMNSVSLAES